MGQDLENIKRAVCVVLDYMLTIGEINNTIDQKNKFVENKKYEEAAKMRDKEKKLRAITPNMDELKKLRDALNIAPEANENLETLFGTQHP